MPGVEKLIQEWIEEISDNNYQNLNQFLQVVHYHQANQWELHHSKAIKQLLNTAYLNIQGHHIHARIKHILFSSSLSKQIFIMEEAKLYEDVLKQDDSDAKFNLALLYQYGQGVPQDDKKAEELLLSAQISGHSQATVNLGVLYQRKEEYSKAIFYYRQAYKEGNILATLYLADLYLQGLGIFIDYQKSKALYLESIKRDECLAIHYSFEDLDDSTVINAYKVSIEHGNSQAMFDLATRYITDENHEEEAIELYHKACDFGHVEALYDLALLYEFGNYVNQDYLQALKLYTIASHLDHTDATYRLARIYHHGLGIKKDLEKAITLYETASQQGHDTAMNDLGCLYFSFKKMKTKYNMEGIRMLKWSIDSNNKTAMYNLGCVYGYGRTGKSDFKKAANLYRMASNLGHKKAKTDLAVLYETGKGVNQDDKAAARLRRESKVFDIHEDSSIYHRYHYYLNEKKHQPAVNLILDNPCLLDELLSFEIKFDTDCYHDMVKSLIASSEVIFKSPTCLTHLNSWESECATQQQYFLYFTLNLLHNFSNEDINEYNIENMLKLINLTWKKINHGKISGEPVKILKKAEEIVLNYLKFKPAFKARYDKLLREIQKESFISSQYYFTFYHKKTPLSDNTFAEIKPFNQ